MTCLSFMKCQFLDTKVGHEQDSMRASVPEKPKRLDTFGGDMSSAEGHPARI